jgi:hypothetical protein
MDDTQDNRKQKLLNLGAETLAEALLDLAKWSEAAENMVERMISGPEENIRRFKKNLSRIKRFQRFLKWDESGDFAQELRELLEDLRVGVKNPSTGLELITLFFKADEKIFNQCDDSSGNIGDIFCYDAKELFSRYAAECEDKEKVAGIILELNRSDDYGIRDTLINCASDCLPEKIIRYMIDEIQVLADSEEGSRWRRHYLGLAGSLARQVKDAELFKQIQIASSEKLSESELYDIACVYFESGDAETALSWLKKIPENDSLRNYETEDLLIKIYKKLGYKDKLTELLYKRFRSYHSTDRLQELLDVIGAGKRDEVLSEAVASIISKDTLDLNDAEFLISIGRIDEAEEYIINRAGKIHGGFYASLLPLAKSMESEARFLTASIIYRSLLCSILDRGYSKAYYHGIRYLKKLDKMAEKVPDWKGFEEHEVFKQRIYDDHKRKRSFWGSYEKK